MKAWHIVAYDFDADRRTIEWIEEWATIQLRELRVSDADIENAAAMSVTHGGFAAHRAEGILALLAEVQGINRLEESSYDSGYFPKVVFASDE